MSFVRFTTRSIHKQVFMQCKNDDIANIVVHQAEGWPTCPKKYKELATTDCKISVDGYSYEYRPQFNSVLIMGKRFLYSVSMKMMCGSPNAVIEFECFVIHIEMPAPSMKAKDLVKACFHEIHTVETNAGLVQKFIDLNHRM